MQHPKPLLNTPHAPHLDTTVRIDGLAFAAEMGEPLIDTLNRAAAQVPGGRSVPQVCYLPPMGTIVKSSDDLWKMLALTLTLSPKRGNTFRTFKVMVSVCRFRGSRGLAGLRTQMSKVRSRRPWAGRNLKVYV